MPSSCKGFTPTPSCLLCRVFGLEEDHEFCYLALERCAGTLAEAMQVRCAMLRCAELRA